MSVTSHLVTHHVHRLLDAVRNNGKNHPSNLSTDINLRSSLNKVVFMHVSEENRASYSHCFFVVHFLFGHPHRSAISFNANPTLKTRSGSSPRFDGHEAHAVRRWRAAVRPQFLGMRHGS